MKELIIIRHGESSHMALGISGGWSDSCLTEIGRKQAQLTGAWLANYITDRSFSFYSSDQTRAKETAEIVGEQLKTKSVLVSALRELNNGEAANLSNEDAAKIANPITHPLVDWVPFPGAESWRAMSNRVIEFLSNLDKTTDLTIIVLHGGSGNAAICWQLGLEIGKHNISFQLDPCSISRFNVNKWNEENIVKINDTSHITVIS